MQSGIEDQPSHHKNPAFDENTEPMPGSGAAGNPGRASEEAVARGRLLIRDGRYPDERVLRAVARVLAERLYPEI